MAEDLHAYYERKADERVQARQQAAISTARNLASAVPVVPGTPTRSFGFQSGAGGPRGEAGRTASLVQAGNELGSPTSFNAGAGAPTPIGVIRGMKQTFATEAGAPQLSEFATPLQAGQAFNRNQLNQDLALAAKTPGVTPNVLALTEKYGGYVPPEGPKIEAAGAEARLAAAAELKSPEKVAEAERIRAAEADRVAGLHVSTLKNYLATTHPGYDKNEITALDAKASEEVARQENRAGNPDAGKLAIGHFQDRQAVRSYLATNPFQLPTGWDVNRYIGALSQNPAAWGEMVKEGQTKRLTAPATATSDPAWNRLSGAARNFGRGAVESARWFNRGVRQVVPGSSAVIDAQGRVAVPNLVDLKLPPADPYAQ